MDASAGLKTVNQTNQKACSAYFKNPFCKSGCVNRTNICSTGGILGAELRTCGLGSS